MNAYPTRKHRFGQPERMVVNVLAAGKTEVAAQLCEEVAMLRYKSSINQSRN